MKTEFDKIFVDEHPISYYKKKLQQTEEGRLRVPLVVKLFTTRLFITPLLALSSLKSPLLAITVPNVPVGGTPTFRFRLSGW